MLSVTIKTKADSGRRDDQQTFTRSARCKAEILHPSGVGPRKVNEWMTVKQRDGIRK
jgi:hypothetical protein